MAVGFGYEDIFQYSCHNVEQLFFVAESWILKEFEKRAEEVDRALGLAADQYTRFAKAYGHLESLLE